MSEQHTDQLEADHQDSDHQDSDQQDSDQQDSGQGDAEQKQGDQDDVDRYDSGQIKDMPEPTDEQKKAAAEMAESYMEERPTTVLPGSDGTVTGTSVNDWIDDDGNPVHGDVSDERKEAAERDAERNKQAQLKDDDADEGDSKDDAATKDDEDSGNDDD